MKINEIKKIAKDNNLVFSSLKYYLRKGLDLEAAMGKAKKKKDTSPPKKDVFNYVKYETNKLRKKLDDILIDASGDKYENPYYERLLALNFSQAEGVQEYDVKKTTSKALMLDGAKTRGFLSSYDRTYPENYFICSCIADDAFKKYKLIAEAPKAVKRRIAPEIIGVIMSFYLETNSEEELLIVAEHEYFDKDDNYTGPLLFLVPVPGGYISVTPFEK